jgi:hypothetical protein
MKTSGVYRTKRTFQSSKKIFIPYFANAPNFDVFHDIEQGIFNKGCKGLSLLFIEVQGALFTARQQDNDKIINSSVVQRDFQRIIIAA